MDMTNTPRRATADALAAAVESSLSGIDSGVMSPPAIAAAGAFLAEAMQIRPGDAAIVHIAEIACAATPTAAERRMRIAVVNRDMPFLVDSVAGCLVRADVAIHILVHPVLAVRRDADGALVAIGDGAAAQRESILYIECDLVDADAREAVKAALLETLDQVRAAVTDWRAMIAAMEIDCNRLGVSESGDLLRWFLKGNLTQLGHEVRDRDGAASGALGICRTEHEPMMRPSTIAAAFAWYDSGQDGLLVLKSNRASRVHRNVLLDLFVVPIRDGGTVVALSVHAGLWTSGSLAAPPSDVPMLRTTLARLMARFNFDPAGHAGKALVHALTYLPHDVLLALDDGDRDRLTMTALSLSDRPRPQIEVASDRLNRHLLAFVWMPRDDMSSSRREAVHAMLTEAANAPMLSWSVVLEESGLALMRVVIDIRDGGRVPASAPLDAALKRMVRGWVPALEAGIAELGAVERAPHLAQRYAAAFPTGYRDHAGAREAAIDVLRLEALGETGGKSARLFRTDSEEAQQLRLKLYGRDAISLSEAVPALENFGFVVLHELSVEVATATSVGHIHEFVLACESGETCARVLDRATLVGEAFAAVLRGEAENDRFNELLVAAAIDPQGVLLLRALFRYQRQMGSAYGLSTVVAALRRAPAITLQLVDYFEALHNPARGAGEDEATAIDRAIEDALADVSAIDDDRILRLYRALIGATLRTNFFAPAGREALAFKLDSTRVPGLPAPLPWREIWVYSPRVEGIHLRTGAIARGGLRWSDRRDDFRTEILGLMKAQRVKNAVIVPTGAKGGFYPKQLPNPAADRDAWFAEGTESYRIFIRALLSVTDNIVRGEVVHPDGVLVRDSDDPYFVVAADKGTATFSDVANAIARERGFWLGDAFASGGSNGYDHKAMGITARGAWISVQRHFLELGIDVQTQPVSVVGVGDMSGDVFGNGMLLSKAIRLVAAFDHRHIFIDPDPDPAASWAERDRLFKLPRSSWADYDQALISKGGGVFARTMKAIPLSEEMRALLDVAAESMEPAALISAILTAPADLLWFGGIGTYVKAAAQSHSDVGDSSNDRIRVNAEHLRVRVIGEGANLAVTQAARIAFDLNGGRINTDFIDNSAGVDCSDNEVNIKIALSAPVADGSLGGDDRNALLQRMTDAVSEIVLEDNRLQALGLSIAEADGARDVVRYTRLMDGFEKAGRLDRAVEGLASDRDLLRRAQDGHGLTRPELAVLFATAKLTMQDVVEAGTLPDDPLMHDMLLRAFPPAMREAHRDAIVNHRLRREIVATKLANRIINRLGVLAPFMLVDEDGLEAGAIARAFVVAQGLFDLEPLWEEIERAPVAEPDRIAAFRTLGQAVATHIGELCRASTSMLPPSDAIEGLKPHFVALGEVAEGRLAARGDAGEGGLPPALAHAIARIGEMSGAAAIADLAIARDEDAGDIARALVDLTDALSLDWLRVTAAALQPTDPWERMLLGEFERDMHEMRLGFLERRKGRPLTTAVAQWIAAHADAIARFQTLIARARVGTPSGSMVAAIASRARDLLERG